MMMMMKKNRFKLFLTLISFSILSTNCSKSADEGISSTQFIQMQKQALSDFVTKLANPTYADFNTRATGLNNSVKALIQTPTAANLQLARQAWRDTRVIWEQSEGFLIGPVEDDNYDPRMDTWPTDHNQLDSLLASPQTLDVSYLESETSDAELTLRGFHPLEYLLWKTEDPTTYSTREREYMSALSQDILNNVIKLQQSWTSGGFGDELVNPGANSSRYSSVNDALTTIAGSLIDICSEVGESKMMEPFSPIKDSTITESPYSHNSIADFKNNITGAYQVYTCSYGNQVGVSISNLVAANNKSLDIELRSLFTAVIQSFDAFSNTTFELAIYTNRSAIQNTLDKITALQESLNNKLLPYLQQYIKK